MNHVVLVGRLTAEPELKYSSKDTPMAITRYTLAIDRRFNKKEENENSADFIRCVAFKKSAEFASKYFHKGQRVAIEGRLHTSTYKDKNDVTHNNVDVIVENQEFADSPAPKIPKAEQEEALMDGFTNIEEDELPFS